MLRRAPSSLFYLEYDDSNDYDDDDDVAVWRGRGRRKLSDNMPSSRKISAAAYLPRPDTARPADKPDGIYDATHALSRARRVVSCTRIHTHTHTHTHPFNGRLSGTTRVSRYQKGKTNLDFTGARDSEWQWHQLGHIQVCTSLQTDNHAGTPPLSFFTGRMPFLPPNEQCQSTEGTAALE